MVQLQPRFTMLQLWFDHGVVELTNMVVVPWFSLEAWFNYSGSTTMVKLYYDYHATTLWFYHGWTTNEPWFDNRCLTRLYKPWLNRRSFTMARRGSTSMLGAPWFNHIV